MSRRLGQRKRRLLAEQSSATSGSSQPPADTNLNTPPPPQNSSSWKRGVAVLVIIFLVVGYWWFRSNQKSQPDQPASLAGDASPQQSQSGLTIDSLSSKIEKERVQVMVLFESPDGKPYHESGGGFVINGKYIATCYHLQAAYHYRIIRAYALCLKPREDTAHPYDSIPIDLSYKAKVTQYDFRKHNYDSTDHRTDVMVYRLKKDLTPNHLSFASQINFGDSVYSIANIPESPESGDYYNTAARGEYVFSLPENQTALDCKFNFVIGNFQKGFSGSAVYDKNGNILGIYIVKVDGDYPPSPGVSQQASADIAKGRAMGWNVGAFIPMDYLKQRYLKGYLDDSE